jgi:hypothetical protein
VLSRRAGHASAFAVGGRVYSDCYGAWRGRSVLRGKRRRFCPGSRFFGDHPRWRVPCFMINVVRRRSWVAVALVSAALANCSTETPDYTGRSCEQSNDSCPAGYACSCFIGCICQPGCKRSSECVRGEVCASTFLGPDTCQKGCETTEECPPHEYCANTVSFFGDPPDQCRPGCHDDSECEPNHVCRFGTCIALCHENSECSDPQTACFPLDGSTRPHSACAGNQRPSLCPPGEPCGCFWCGPVSLQDSSTDANADAKQ